MEILGIDVGGSGIKGALVDVETGAFIGERHRVVTPQPALPETVGDAIVEIVNHFKWNGLIGCTFPSVIKQGIIYTTANIDKSWSGLNGETLLSTKTGCPVFLINDADAAGLAEMELGAGKGQQGLVIMLTFGTGIGSAIFINGHLVPNTEFGHMEIRGMEAEHRAAARIRKEEDLSWVKWAHRVNEFLERMENLFWPDLFIVGGGVSKNYEKFFPLLQIRTRIVPAQLRNQAGIVGAALNASRHTHLIEVPD